MTESETKVVDRPLGVGELVNFYPAEGVRGKHSIPDARYAAMCIGTQQNKQPILRVYVPVPPKSKRKLTDMLPPMSIKHDKSGLSMDLGRPGNHGPVGVEREGRGVLFFANSDFTVWCDEDETFGTWERIDGE